MIMTKIQKQAHIQAASKVGGSSKGESRWTTTSMGAE